MTHADLQRMKTQTVVAILLGVLLTVACVDGGAVTDCSSFVVAGCPSPYSAYCGAFALASRLTLSGGAPGGVPFTCNGRPVFARSDGRCVPISADC